MGGWHPTRDRLLTVLGDGEAKTHREIVEVTGLSEMAVWGALRRCWRGGYVLRSEKPVREHHRRFKGRAGVSTGLRSYHLYLLRPENVDSLRRDGHRFVSFAEEYVDKRGVGGKSKAQIILDFLRENGDRAFYSKDIVEALKDRGIRPSNVMTNVRIFQRKGLVYVRGYKEHDRQTPFKEGYLITWIDQDMPREEAVREAVQRTEDALMGKASTSPIVARVRMIRDQIIAASQLKNLVNFAFLKNEMACTKDKAEQALMRTLQLYPDLKEIKIFDRFRYYYHSSMEPEDLKATIMLKENYVRKVKGRDNRIGHNWEACVEWFIDKFTTGAKFWTQKHRIGGMDPRRITIHLIKSVAGRRRNAEVDRVWEVTPGIFAQPITYVLECKWGVFRKRHIDDFFNILRWSKEFGVETESGRIVRQGVVGIFAGGTFDPREKIYLENGSVSLATYANRMDITLLHASDFNRRLQERGCEKYLTVQKICKAARNEQEVREALDRIWESPGEGRKIIGELREKNRDIYQFEEMLKQTSKVEGPATEIPKVKIQSSS